MSDIQLICFVLYAMFSLIFFERSIFYSIDKIEYYDKKYSDTVSVLSDTTELIIHISILYIIYKG